MDSAAPAGITVDDAVARIVEYLKEGRLREAAATCVYALDTAPDHADALHYSGVLAHKLGRSEDAAALIRRSLARSPHQADWHSNLGVVLQSTGDFDAAIVAFRHAIAIDPAHGNAYANLGVLLRGVGQLDEAEAAYRRAIELTPDNPAVHHNLAILLDQTGRTQDALAAYCRALTLNPSQAHVRRHLAMAYSVLGESEKAIAVCEAWVRAEPDNPQAQHALAAYSGRNVPPRASDAYVRKVFDAFAEGFDAKLARLDYRAPALIVEALAASGAVSDGSLDVLDAGCGTGLCGPLLAPYARHLVGVDLSRGMLDVAQTRQTYHALVQEELTAYLQRQHEAFDVIVSADTLVYFGELDGVAAAAAGALRPGGIFVFTVEEAADAASTGPFSLQPHGRFVHGAEYVEAVLSRAGLDPVSGREVLRKESGLPVAGLVVRATKGDAHA